MSSTLLNCIDCAGGGIINVNHCNNIKTVYGSAIVYWYIQTKDNNNTGHILVASDSNTIIFGFVDVNTNLVIISSLFFTTKFNRSSYRNNYLSIDHITFNGLNFYPYTFPELKDGYYGNYVAGTIYITSNDKGLFNDGTDITTTYKNFLFYYKDSNYTNALYTMRTSDGSMFEWTQNFAIVKLIDVEFSTKLNDTNRYQIQ